MYSAETGVATLLARLAAQPLTSGADKPEFAEKLLAWIDKAEKSSGEQPALSVEASSGQAAPNCLLHWRPEGMRTALSALVEQDEGLHAGLCQPLVSVRP